MPPPVNEPDLPDMRSFRALAGVTFLCSFSDNLFRLVAWLIAGHFAAELGRGEDDFRSLVSIFYTAPWIFLSLLAGQLADRFSKRSVIIGTKIAELAILCAGLAASYAFDSWPVSLGILLLLGCRMAVFGPSTFGLIPETMPERRLSWANGWIDGLMFLGAIIGTSAGGLALDLFGPSLRPPLLILIGLASLGLFCALIVDKVPAASPERRIAPLPLRQTMANFREIGRSPGLTQAFVGIVVWWALAALALQTAMKLAEDTLGLTGFGTSRFFIYVGVGVGLGSWAAGRLSGNRIELGLVPLGGFLMGAASIAVYFVPPGEFASGATISLVGFFAGFFIIPLKAFVQHKARPETRGGILGLMNLFSYSAIFASGGPVYYFLTRVLEFDAQQMFLSLGVFCLFVAGFSLRSLPNAALRLLLFVASRALYRLRIEGHEHVPASGGALLVCNHLSFMDGLLVVASTERPVRPIMLQGIRDSPLVLPFAKLARAIPISDRMGPRELVKSLQQAGESVKAGEVVLIFAEGQISRTGQLLPFRKGLERIMKDVDAPIVPVHLDRLRGTMLAYDFKRALRRLPDRLPMPVTVSFGAPLPGSSPAAAVRTAMQMLASDAWRHRKEDAPLLHREAFASARRHPLERAFFDANNRKGLTRAAFAGGTVVMAKELRSILDGEPMAGICMPPSNAGAVVNHAALLLGKPVVNLNYTASTDVLKGILAQCGIRKVITSRAFLEKAKIEIPGELVFLEDIAPRIGSAAKLVGTVQALALPTAWIERMLGAPAGRAPGDLATVIFSSGSTGIPKGVMLSHWNIGSNLQSLREIFPLHRSDRILGILPFFHSFGTTATLFLPHSLGIGVVYWPNPIDANGVGEMVESHAVTFMVATPTFLQNYTRRVEPRQFGSLRIALTGAEKLRPAVANAFEERFGIKPFEGYGCTECGPAVAVNTHDYRAPGYHQKANKPGTIGQPIPGVAVRIVDPATREDRSQGDEGLLVVKGQNIMMGYLGAPEKTAEAIQEDWYSTGDIARIDDEGFVQITDRLSRFSKIGGEMVPHIRIEEAMHAAIGATEQIFSVTGIPDDKKGERLAVLYTCADDEAKAALDKAGAGGDIPNLWLPKARDMHRVERIPVLGTGKTDLREVKRIATEKCAGAGGE